MKKYKKISIILFSMFFIFSVVFASNYEDYEKQLNTIKKKLEAGSSNLQGIEREINVLLIQICDLDGQIAKAQDQITKIETKSKEVEVEIQENKEQIVTLNQIVETDTLKYEDRLRSIYENGSLNFWDIVFSSKNFVDFLRKYEFASKIIESDKTLYVNITTKQTVLTTTKQKIEVKTMQLDSLKENRDEALTKLLEEKNRRQEIIKSLESDKAKAEAQQAILQKQEDKLNKDLEDEIKKMVAEYKAAHSTGLGGVSGTPNAQGFIWPVGGTGGVVTAGFPNYPASFGGGKHDGMDIASKDSPPVRACKKGTVLRAIADRPENTYPYAMQYGNYIVILHEDGVTTSLYGHLASVMVKEGDVVETGQQIGILGNSGYSTGAHCHFEIRINGVPQQPLDYVSK